MSLFDSIFGIDITGDGDADYLDDAIIIAALEEEEEYYDNEDNRDEETE